MAVPGLIDNLFRRQSAQIAVRLTRALGARHLELAEDAVQDALVSALQTWPYRGIPDDPAAWLYQVARNRALDRLRHSRMAGAKAGAIAATVPAAGPAARDPALEGEPQLDDDELTMMFLTCHPALGRESRVALTLKIVGGFGVREIARAFLAEEPAVAQRVVRAKRRLREIDAPFAPPGRDEVAARLDAVLEAVYLMFTEGYTATSGDALVREDVAGEALRLARLLSTHPLTRTPRVEALRALICLHAARFPSRTGTDGALFLLRDQDRAAWDRRLIVEGMHALDRASSGDEVSSYHLEAGIAACHAVAPSYDETDWTQIVSLYDDLYIQTESPIVGLNRAIARSRVEGARTGIEALGALEGDPRLARYHPLKAVLAELWREAGDAGRARQYLDAALASVMSAPERRWLEGRRGL
jgi:RNA polymerase sigma-70 factor (ECF subfamily)